MLAAVSRLVAPYVSLCLSTLHMEAALRAIAEPHRRRILELVAEDERSAGEIAGAFDITRPAVSQHLTVLKSAGLVAERRDGTRRLYRIRPEGFTDLKAFLERFWGDGLERLKLAAELEEGRRRRASRAG
jgi:DNA-binding transcriptional ArsR family regulator